MNRPIAFQARSVVLISILLGWTTASWAAEPAATTAPQKLNVDGLKQKYWEKTEESELRVVQNRVFIKAHRVEADIFGGFMSSDPFLSVKALGLALSYHLNESFSIGGFYLKELVKRSSALEDLETQVGRTANTNPPQSYIAAEGTWSPIYGKLALLGESIIHYDLHLALGAGTTKTVNGSYMTVHAGIGQQVFLGSHAVLRIDYRLMRYAEDICDRANTLSSTYGKLVNNRTNYTDSFLIGLGYFF